MPFEEFEPRPGALEIAHVVLDEPEAFPAHVRDAWERDQGGLVVATSEDELAELWTDPLTGEPPEHYLAESIIVAFGTLERAVCPLRVRTVDARPDDSDVGIHLRVFGTADDCGRQFIPRTFVLAIPRGVVTGASDLQVELVRPDGPDDVRAGEVSP
jgi:hypothetical protein